MLTMPVPGLSLAGAPRMRPADRRRSDAVHDAYSLLADAHVPRPPSAGFKSVFQAAVLMEIQRRLCSDEGARESPVSPTARLSILEVGCGDGRGAGLIFENAFVADRAIEYHGIDFAEPRILSARERLSAHPTATFTVADADEYEPCRAFDLILAAEVISHLSRRHYRMWLRRWRDWLAPGGAVIVIDQDKYTWHSMRLRWDCLARRCLPAILRGRPYSFAPELADILLPALHYPSFGQLARVARRLGYRPRPLLAHASFRALIADWPGF